MTVGDLYRVLWRHKLLIGFLTSLVVAGAWYYAGQRPKVYEATTVVRVAETAHNPNDVFDALQTGGKLAETYSEVIGTSAITSLVGSELHGTVPASRIDGALSASQVGDLALLKISAKGSDPVQVAAIANAAPAALRDFVARSGTVGNTIVTLQPAGIPRAPVSPNVKLDVAIALLLGLMLNGALAFVIDALGDTAADPEEVERLCRAPVLAVIPNLSFAPRASVNLRLAQTSAPGAKGA